MTFQIREIQVKDLPTIFDVRLSTVENAVTLEVLARDYDTTPESLADAMRTDVKGWLGEKSGRVAGFAMGDRGSGEVLVVAVRPEFEGQGVGGQLLAKVQSWLFSQGYEAIWLRASPDAGTRAHGFYRRLGWQPTGRMAGEDEILTLRFRRG